MKVFTIKPLAGVLLSACSVLSGNVWASSTVNFQGVPSAVSGHANATGGSGFTQDGVVAGVVADPRDSGAHFHRAGPTTDREAQYHPDSTGIYVRREDNASFSLQSIWLDVTNGSNGGSFVIYGFENAINDGLLGAGNPDPNNNQYFLDDADVEGGNKPHIASYTFANDGSFAQNVTLADLVAQDPGWGNNIGAFWITFMGFNNSPTKHYAPDAEGLTLYPDWDLRVDDIILGDAVTTTTVPIPAAVWLFGSALASLGVFGRRKQA